MYTFYLVLFAIGALGIVIQAALGGLHAGHAGHASGGHSGGHAGGHGLNGHVGYSHSAAHNHSGGSSHHAETVGPRLLMLLSPLAIFSICLGAGGAGLILEHFRTAHEVVLPAALIAGFVFHGLIVRPMLGLMYRFASKPSLALDGSLAQEAEVVSKFNEAGEGIVRLNVDGQLVRVLAKLDEGDRADAGVIVVGERLVVTSVDGKSNSCRVARLS